MAENIYATVDSRYYTECWSLPGAGDIVSAVTDDVWQGQNTKKKVEGVAKTDADVHS